MSKPIWEGKIALTCHSYHLGTMVDNQFKFRSVEGEDVAVTIDMPTAGLVGSLFPVKRALKITIEVADE